MKVNNINGFNFVNGLNFVAGRCNKNYVCDASCLARPVAEYVYM